MSEPAPQIQLYRQYTAAGTVRHRFAGVAATIRAGDDPAGPAATWDLTAATVPGCTPKAGDRYQDATGAWWAVRSVGPRAAGLWPLTCQREE